MKLKGGVVDEEVMSKRKEKYNIEYLENIILNEAKEKLE